MRVSAADSDATPAIELDASKHPIKSITVFSSCKAEVVRTFAVELEEGQNEVHITSIPSCIDTDTTCITISGDAILFDDIWTVDPAPAPPPASIVTSHTIKALERARAVLEGQKTLRGHAADILVQYGHSMKAETNNGGVESVNGFLNAMLERGDTILSDAEEVDAKIEKLDCMIEDERNKLVDYMKHPLLLGSVTASIMARSPGNVEITLTYMVNNASWSPVYDLRATTENGQPPTFVSLHYRAAIQQNTGEDWRNTSITVSTETPGLNETIPALRALWITPAKTTTTTNASARKGPALPNSQADVHVANSPMGVPGTASQSADDTNVPASLQSQNAQQRVEQPTAIGPGLSNSVDPTPNLAALQRQQYEQARPSLLRTAEAVSTLNQAASQQQRRTPSNSEMPLVAVNNGIGSVPTVRSLSGNTVAESTQTVTAQQQQAQTMSPFFRIANSSALTTADQARNLSPFGKFFNTYTPTAATRQQQQVQTPMASEGLAGALSPVYGHEAVASMPDVAAQQHQQSLPGGSPVVVAPGIFAQRHQQQQQQQKAGPAIVNSNEGLANVNAPNVSPMGKSLGSAAASGSHTHGKNAKWTETGALVTESAVPSVFHIEGHCSIPSEPIPHKVTIALLSLDAKMNHVVVPRTASCAHMQSKVTNTSDYRLLPGPMNVYLNNRSVSKASMPDVDREKSFHCTFGSDPLIRIKCTRFPRSLAMSSSQYAAQVAIATYKLQTEIENTHTFPISDLLVRDAAPTPVPTPSSSAGSRGIKVILKRPEGLGEAEPGEVVPVDVSGKGKGKGAKVRWPSDSARKVGKYEWMIDLGAGEKITLEAEYDVRAPSDVKWVLNEDFYID